MASVPLKPESVRRHGGLAEPGAASRNSLGAALPTACSSFAREHGSVLPAILYRRWGARRAGTVNVAGGHARKKRLRIQKLEKGDDLRRHDDVALSVQRCTNLLSERQGKFGFARRSWSGGE